MFKISAWACIAQASGQSSQGRFPPIYQAASRPQFHQFQQEASPQFHHETLPGYQQDQQYHQNQQVPQFQQGSPSQFEQAKHSPEFQQASPQFQQASPQFQQASPQFEQWEPPYAQAYAQAFPPQYQDALNGVLPQPRLLQSEQTVPKVQPSEVLELPEKALPPSVITAEVEVSIVGPPLPDLAAIDFPTFPQAVLVFTKDQAELNQQKETYQKLMTEYKASVEAEMQSLEKMSSTHVTDFSESFAARIDTQLTHQLGMIDLEQQRQLESLVSHVANQIDTLKKEANQRTESQTEKSESELHDLVSKIESTKDEQLEQIRTEAQVEAARFDRALEMISSYLVDVSKSEDTLGHLQKENEVKYMKEMTKLGSTGIDAN